MVVAEAISVVAADLAIPQGLTAVEAEVLVTSTPRVAQLATPKPQRWAAKQSLLHSLVVEAVISMWQVLRLAVAAM